MVNTPKTLERNKSRMSSGQRTSNPFKDAKKPVSEGPLSVKKLFGFFGRKFKDAKNNDKECKQTMAKRALSALKEGKVEYVVVKPRIIEAFREGLITQEELVDAVKGYEEKMAKRVLDKLRNGWVLLDHVYPVLMDAVEKGYLDKEEVDEGIREYEKRMAKGALEEIKMGSLGYREARPYLIEALKKGYITQEEIDDAIEYQRKREKIRKRKKAFYFLKPIFQRLWPGMMD